jgi:hypothetical protein
MARTYYAQHLASYDWARIAADCDGAIADLVANPGREDAEHGLASADRPEDGIVRASVYLGRTYRDAPSGSFYAPWSAVPDSVRDADSRWYDALERAARKFGLSIESGEGDPTDTYATRWADAGGAA